MGSSSPPELVHQLSGVPTLIDAAADQLSTLANTIPDLLIENKRVVLAVHYRMVADAWYARIEQTVDQMAERWPALHKTTGKMVLELRPNLDWHKGSALLWLLSTLPAARPVVPIFIGDDTTDEDAFEAVAGRGIGIAVDVQHPTAARYAVKDVAEVYELLDRISGLAMV
jgi:trehalose-phosphatase